MLNAGLHAGGRNGPDFAEKVDLAPTRAKHLAGPCRRQDGEFQSQRLD